MAARDPRSPTAKPRPRRTTGGKPRVALRKAGGASSQAGGAPRKEGKAEPSRLPKAARPLKPSKTVRAQQNGPRTARRPARSSGTPDVQEKRDRTRRVDADDVVPIVTEVPRVSGPVDVVLTAAVIALVVFGVVMVYSASTVFAHARYGNAQYFLVRQGIFALVGIPVMIGISRVDYHRFQRFTYPFLLGSLGLLMVTIVGLGRRAKGAERWISLGPINIQPVELAKVALVAWLAYSLSKKSERIRTFSVGFLPHVLMAGVLMVLSLQQPDFGSAVMIGMLTFVLLFTAGARLPYLLLTVLVSLPTGYELVMASAYRRRRWEAFQDPWEYRYDEGYQLCESLMSFGAGGGTGVGMGDSRQKLFFLPEAHTDFIGAIIGEELGFVGLLGLVLAFLLVIYRGFRAALRAVDDYGTYLAVGVTMFVGLQVFTNLGVALGMLPTDGLVLPFISYGGSALLVNCAAMGVLLNISRPRGWTGAGGTVRAPRPSRLGAARAAMAGGTA